MKILKNAVLSGILSAAMALSLLPAAMETSAEAEDTNAPVIYRILKEPAGIFTDTTSTHYTFGTFLNNRTSAVKRSNLVGSVVMSSTFLITDIGGNQKHSLSCGNDTIDFSDTGFAAVLSTGSLNACGIVDTNYDMVCDYNQNMQNTGDTPERYVYYKTPVEYPSPLDPPKSVYYYEYTRFDLFSHASQLLLTDDGSHVYQFGDGVTLDYDAFPSKEKKNEQQPYSYWGVSGGPYFKANPFSNGYAVVQVNQGDNVQNIIDKNGKICGSFSYSTNGSDFNSAGLLRVNLDGGYGLIDKTGALVTTKAYSEIRGVSDGMIAVVSDGKYGFVNSSGSEVIAPQYLQADDFSEGYAVVENADSSWSFIDKTGKQMFSGTYRGAYSFKNGYARVMGSDYMWKLIDKKGRTVNLGDYWPVSDVSKNGIFWIGAFGGKDSNGKMIEYHGIAQLHSVAAVHAVQLSMPSTQLVIPTNSGNSLSNHFGMNATLTDSAGEELVGKDVTWSIKEASHEGVTIDPVTGELTVAPGARAGTYTAVAACGTQDGTAAAAQLAEDDSLTKELSFTVKRAEPTATSIGLFADGTAVGTAETLAIYTNHESSRTYTAKVLDQYGEEMRNADITWSATTAAGGPTVSGGTVTIPSKTTAGTAASVKASCGNLSAAVTVTAKAIPESWAAVTQTASGGTTTVTVKNSAADGPEIRACFIAAAYDASGRMTDTKTATASLCAGASVDLQISCPSGGKVKVFALDAEKNNPLASAVSPENG